MRGSEARCEADVAPSLDTTDQSDSTEPTNPTDPTDPTDPSIHSAAIPSAAVAPVADSEQVGATARLIPRAVPRVVLVDAFNVLHAVLLGKDRQTGWWKKALRERLLERVTRWDGGPDEIWVAFDGSRPAMSVYAEPIAMADEARPQGPTVHSLFVESADDWIVRRARRAERPDRVIVVSADRKVAGRARSAGCEVWTPWAFMAHCPEEDSAAESESSEA